MQLQQMQAHLLRIIQKNIPFPVENIGQILHMFNAQKQWCISSIYMTINKILPTAVYYTIAYVISCRIQGNK